MFLMPSQEYLSVSSSLVKEIHAHGGDVSRLVPPLVAERMHAKRAS
jgi:pantetheine-phosphate adenylyltransferase